MKYLFLFLITACGSQPTQNELLAQRHAEVIVTNLEKRNYNMTNAEKRTITEEIKQEILTALEEKK